MPDSINPAPKAVVPPGTNEASPETTDLVASSNQLGGDGRLGNFLARFSRSLTSERTARSIILIASPNVFAQLSTSSDLIAAEKSLLALDSGSLIWPPASPSQT